MRYLRFDQDEKFILYGAFPNLAFMIDPVLALVFYSLTALVLLVTISRPSEQLRFSPTLAGLARLLSDFILSATLLLPIEHWPGD